MKKNKLWLGITAMVVALVLVVGIAGSTHAQSESNFTDSLDKTILDYVQAKLGQVQNAAESFGAAGKLFIEDYLPYVRYNEGIKTALPIESSNIDFSLLLAS